MNDSAALEGSSNARRCDVVHVITGLNHGGAENMLLKLLEREAAEPCFDRAAPRRQRVVSLMRPGPAAARLKPIGAPLDSLGLNAGAAGPAGFVKLRGLIAGHRPDVVVGWMHHAFFGATLATATMSNAPPLIWNVRHSLVDIKREKPLTRVILRACAAMSARPAAIVYNSRVAQSQYEALGFCAARSRFIPNGFDCDQFKPDAAARARLQRLFDIPSNACPSNACVVAMIARQHPMKNLAGLLSAVREARAAGRALFLLLVGQGMDDLPADLSAQLASAGAPYRVSGHRADIADWLAGVDILAAPSAWGEGFPNILGEAMACGAAVLATDVGDSAWIVGEAGRIAPPADNAALAAGLMELIDLGADGRAALGRAGRARVIKEFGIARIAAQYEALYEEIASAKAAPSADASNRRVAGEVM